MYKSIVFLFILAVIASCNKPKKENIKVIVVHARGISYPEMQEYLATTTSDLFFNRNKKNIKKLIPITNAVTISNIASFETGNSPDKHGIVGHLYVKKENDKLNLVSGFSQPFETETFWEKADAKGKKVLNIGSLTLHGKHKTHKNVDALSQGTQISKPILATLVASDKENSVIKYSIVNSNIKTPVLKLYREESGNKNEFFLDDDYNPKNAFAEKITVGKWFTINNNNQQIKGKLTQKSQDTLSLYIRPNYVNKGYPDEFIKQINTDIGNPTGWPNIAYYTSQKIDGKTLLEEVYSESKHILKVFKSTSQKKEYDLIMIDYPLMDRIGHAFLGLKKDAKDVQKEYQKAFKQMNKDFNSIENFAKQHGYDLIITSGHGFSAVHSSIDINKFLTASNININFQDKNWEAVGIQGKVSAHIYLNDKLDNDSKEKVLQKIELAFKNLKHKNQFVVDETFRKKNLKNIGLSHKNSGDLFVLLNPGYVFENNNTKNDFWGIPKFKGDHGYSLKHPESFGVLISNDDCTSCKSIDVAKMIENKLKI